MEVSAPLAFWGNSQESKSKLLILSALAFANPAIDIFDRRDYQKD